MRNSMLLAFFLLMYCTGSLSAQCSGSISSACGISASYPWEDWIWGVQIGSINNNPGTSPGNGKSTYTDYTSTCTDLAKGNNHAITVTVGFSYLTYAENLGVWIDFNNNGAFTDAGEQVVQTVLSPAPANGTPSAAYTVYFMVPSTVSVGPRRMRIAMRRDAAPASCTSYTYGEIEDYKVNITNSACNSPTITSTTSTSTSITVNWSAVSGATGYRIRYKVLPSGGWSSLVTPTGTSHTFSSLTPNTCYQVELYTTCSGGNSTSVFATQCTQSYCLVDPNAGKYGDTIGIGNSMNQFNPQSLRDMFALNDGGLHFRHYGSGPNPILALTTNIRNFHTIDEDFSGSGGGNAILPKNTTPNGNPASIAVNQSWYSQYKTAGVTNMSAAIERLAGYGSWSEKMYFESDWSSTGYSGIQAAVKKYTEVFIDANAHPTNTTLRYVNNFEVGNELWGWPEEVDYHNMLKGVREGFVSKYGAKSAGNWKMKFVAGAMQAWRDDNCANTSRDVNNCSDLSRFDHIGNYLNLNDCNVLNDLDAINVHPYSLLPNTTTYAHPEHASSEFWQIRNLAKWRQVNTSMSSKEMWATEYGFDSDAVGTLTQSAYNLRGFFIMSRFQFSRVYFYNAYDKHPSYGAFYRTCGFMTNPDIGTATKKPTYYTFEEVVGTTGAAFGNKKFFKAVAETPNLYAYIIADNSSGANPYLVIWNPSATTDSGVFTPSSTTVSVSWSAALPNFKLESTNATFFKTSTSAGSTFSATSATPCGSAVLKGAPMPAYIRLVSCCTPPSAPSISASSGTYTPGGSAVILTATGCSGGTVKWYTSGGAYLGSGTTWSVTPSVTTTYYATCTVSSCESSASNHVTITVSSGSCPLVYTFKRRPHANSGCRTSGDYYFEIVLNNVVANDQITISGLPSSGINPTMSSLNGVNFTTTTFNANVQYLSATSYKWLVSTSNGSTQTLKLYYCWASAYPSPVSSTTATSLCSGAVTSCTDSPSFKGGATNALGVNPGERSFDIQPEIYTVVPNPGSDEVEIRFTDDVVSGGTVNLWSMNGQVLRTFAADSFQEAGTVRFQTTDMPSGMYLIGVLANDRVYRTLWIKK